MDFTKVFYFGSAPKKSQESTNDSNQANTEPNGILVLDLESNTSSEISNEELKQFRDEDPDSLFTEEIIFSSGFGKLFDEVLEEEIIEVTKIELAEAQTQTEQLPSISNQTHNNSLIRNNYYFIFNLLASVPLTVMVVGVASLAINPITPLAIACVTVPTYMFFFSGLSVLNQKPNTEENNHMPII